MPVEVALLASYPSVVGTLSDGAHNGGGLNGQDAYTGRILPVMAHGPIAVTASREIFTGDGVLADPIGANEANTYTNEGSNNFRLHNCVGEPRGEPNGVDKLNDGIVGALTARGGRNAGMANDDLDARRFALQAMAVRRLTPVECERLQGFPADYTAIPWRNKTSSECPDGPRYKALGNSMAVPVIRWLGVRIGRSL